MPVEMEIATFLLFAAVFAVQWLASDYSGHTSNNNAYPINNELHRRESKEFDGIQSGKALLVVVNLGLATWVYFFGSVFS